jgi:hypothetical protein
MQQRVKLTVAEKAVMQINNLGDMVFLTMGVTESQQPLSKDHVAKALRIMQRRHPLLRAHLDIDSENDDDWCYVICDADNDAEMLTCKLQWLQCDNREQAMQAVEKFANSVFDFKVKDLLWHCHVAEFDTKNNKYTIALQTAGAITDGLNGVVLLVELVTLINFVLGGQQCDEMTSRLQYPANYYDASVNGGILTDELKLKLEQLKSEQDNAEGEHNDESPQPHAAKTKFLLPEKKFRVGEETGARLIFFKFDIETTSKLLTACKKNNQRLTGVLAAVKFYSLRQLFQEHGVDFPEKLVCSMPMNLRMRYSPNMDFSVMGPHVMAAECYFSYPKSGELIDNESFARHIWSSATAMNAEIAEKTSVTEVHSFKFLFDLEGLAEATKLFAKAYEHRDEETIEMLMVEKESDFAVSNIGRWVWDRKRPAWALDQKRDASPRIKLVETYFADAMKSTPGFINGFVQYCSFWNGELDFSLTMNASLIGKEYGRRFVELYTANMQRLVNESK